MERRELENLESAGRWCAARGSGWALTPDGLLGQGATAFAYQIETPFGVRCLKLYEKDFSLKEGPVGRRRIEQQVELGEHDCPWLVKVYEGGVFEERLFLVMSRAPGRELEKCLTEIPRRKVRPIVDQVARAVLFLHSRDLCHRDIKAANIYISEDFERAVLLDISVMRDMYDPMGAGTDHDGQLPVVATTRYTPPEYLFRLVEPGPDLWHALNIYQLGALLHDLIMREPLFQSEQARSMENRYTLAWAVATKIPRIHAEDVESDLVFTAQRALDKDWKRRSGLSVEDFLADSTVLQTHALMALGLSTERESLSESDVVTLRLQRIREIAEAVEEAVEQYFRKNRVIVNHETKPGVTDLAKRLVFSWPTTGTSFQEQVVTFAVTINLLVRESDYSFVLSATLSTETAHEKRAASLDLPEVPDEPSVHTALSSQIENAFLKLSIEIGRPSSILRVE